MNVFYRYAPDGKKLIGQGLDKGKLENGDLLREVACVASQQILTMVEVLEREFMVRLGLDLEDLDIVFENISERLKTLANAASLASLGDDQTDPQPLLDIVFGKGKWLLAEKSQTAAICEEETST